MGAWRRLDDLWRFEERCGRGHGGEFGRELAEAQVLGPALDEPEGGRVPEGRRAAVAEDDLVVVGQREQLADAVTKAAHDRLHGRLTVAGAQVGWSRGGEGSHRLLAHLRRSRPEATVGRPQLGRKLDLRHGRSHSPLSVKSATEAKSTMAHARISQRVGSIEESATLAIDARVKALKAEGADVIGFGAGEPDFPTPEHIVVAAETACRDPRFHHYTPTAGLPELRTAVADKTAGDLGMPVKAAQVLVTNGAKQALYNTFATLLDPGDEVLFTSPYWVTYPESIRLAGGLPVPVETDESTGFRATVEQLEAARTPRTKLLLFASPKNPTGTV